MWHAHEGRALTAPVRKQLHLSLSLMMKQQDDESEAAWESFPQQLFFVDNRGICLKSIVCESGLLANTHVSYVICLGHALLRCFLSFSTSCPSVSSCCTSIRSYTCNIWHFQVCIWEFDCSTLRGPHTCFSFGVTRSACPAHCYWK